MFVSIYECIIIFEEINTSLNPSFRRDTLQRHVVKLSRSFVTVWVTVPRRPLAVKLSCLAVESGLAACAQISGPLESIYRWQGIVESAKEWRVVLKTRSRLLPKLEALVMAHHPYETPQFVVLPMVGGSAKYVDWLAESTTAAPPRSLRKRSKKP